MLVKKRQKVKIREERMKKANIKTVTVFSFHLSYFKISLPVYKVSDGYGSKNLYLG